MEFCQLYRTDEHLDAMALAYLRGSANATNVSQRYGYQLTMDFGPPHLIHYEEEHRSFLRQ